MEILKFNKGTSKLYSPRFLTDTLFLTTTDQHLKQLQSDNENGHQREKKNEIIHLKKREKKTFLLSFGLYGHAFE